MQRFTRVKVRETLRENRFDAFEPIASLDCRSQHCRLHDRKEQRRHQLQRHEPYKQLRNPPRSSVCVIHHAILRTRFRSSRSWLAACQ